MGHVDRNSWKKSGFSGTEEESRAIDLAGRPDKRNTYGYNIQVIRMRAMTRRALHRSIRRSPGISKTT